MSYIGQAALKNSELKRFDVTSSTSATHVLSWTAPNEQSLWITINGVKQQNDAYSIAGSPTTITLTDALVATDKMEVIGVLDIGVITTPGDNTVSTATLGDNAVTTAKIAADAVTAAEIAANAVDTAEIAANAVGLTELSDGTQGGTLYYGAAGAPTQLAAGTSGQFLKTQGAAANPVWDSVDIAGIISNRDDIALLGFRVASNGSLAKYNLVDQTVDDFQDATGVNAGGSTNEVRDASGKYYQGGVPGAGDSTGGTITYSGGNTIHSFTADGNFVVPSSGTIGTYLVIAGGASGGTGGGGGGGGAGGMVEGTSHAVTQQTYAITVGEGGAVVAGGAGANGLPGENSVFDTVTGTGGGYGAKAAFGAGTGGSGGGAGYGGAGGPTGGSGFVFAGGAGGPYGGGPANSHSGGGGGGASAVGLAGTNASGSGNGGNGRANSITGASVTYAGGGGGGTLHNFYSGSGGTGGGGAGGTTSGGNGVDGTDGKGAGGGGSAGSVNTYTGGKGGDGIVILSYTTDSFTVDVPANLTLVSNTTAAQAAPTKGDVVFTYTNGAGSTTLDTDVTAEISADGGSTWTAMTLGSEGSTGSHNIATAHDVTISSTITSPWNMAYRIKTLNQSASKTTRIQAVSLGWS